MEEEVVRRRGWLDSGRFLDMLGATSLIPGPNSTEMAMHVGFVRAGGRGLVVAGAAFILPAALLTGVLAWAYVRFGSLPSVAPLLAGIKPAVLAVIVGALFRLGRVATRTPALAALAALAGVAVLAGLNEVLVLVATGVLGGAALWTAGRQAPTSLAVIPWAVGSAGASVLYGSGYVLIAFLEGELVEGLGWLTHGQLLDAIAIGQFTPGPVLTTATFIGYLVAGLPGAVVATAGIFLPSFVFVRLLGPILPRIRERRWAGALLDSVNAAAVGLMAAVTLTLTAGALTGWQAWAIAASAVVLSLRFGVGPTWLVIGGAIAGWVLG
jgi:chromate transporter